MTKGQAEDFGRHFDIRRTKDARGNVGTIRGNAVNLTMPAASTDFDTLMEISRSAQKPFPVKLLSEKLREKKYIRGRVFFGSVVKVIATILLDYPLLRWWIEQDGLVVDEARSEMGLISDFDRIAGALMIEHSRDGKLSAEALGSIAEKLDEEGFELKENLQAAQWKPISGFNQRNARSPVKTFVAAVKRDQLVRSVRRRLYTARDRYTSALRPAEPITIEI